MHLRKYKLRVRLHVITDPFGATLGLLGLVITQCVWDKEIARAYGICWDAASDTHIINRRRRKKKKKKTKKSSFRFFFPYD